MTFAVTPQALNAKDLINYLTKQGSTIFDQGCKALDDKALADGFAMTSNQTVIFVEVFYHHTVAMGWTQGSKQITNFTNSARVTVDIIKCYGQISEVTLKTACERFCKVGENNAESRATQNNAMMATCLVKSLTADAQARLLTYYKEYTFEGVKYSPLMYKVIMRLATIDTVATTQTLRDNLQNLGVFAATVNGNINKIHGKFDKNFSQLIAHGVTVDDPIGILFDAYSVVPCYNFKQYIKRQHKDYLDGKLTSITHENLMTSTMRKYNYLKVKGQWGAKSPDLCLPPAALSKATSSLMISLASLSTKRKSEARRRRTRRVQYSKQGRSEKGQSMEEGASQGWKETYQGSQKVHLPLVCAPHVVDHPPSRQMPPQQTAQGRAEGQASNDPPCQHGHLCRGHRHSNQSSLPGHACGAG